MKLEIPQKERKFVWPEHFDEYFERYVKEHHYDASALSMSILKHAIDNAIGQKDELSIN